MTAFAQRQIEIGGLQLLWELKSVNHRFLEMQFRLPEPLRGAEAPLREAVRRRLKRGRLDCALRLAPNAGVAGALPLNRPLLLQLLAVLDQVRRDAPEIQAPNLMDILRWPGLLGDESALGTAEAIAAAVQTFQETLDVLIEARRQEGRQLRQAMLERLDGIEGIADDLRRETAGLAGEVRSRLRKRLGEWADGIESKRMEQEVALLAQKADVAEELDRLIIHVREARNQLDGPGPQGRRLDFLSQEMNREASALGAKSVLAQTSRRVVDLKVLIEQMREQVQNLE